MKITRYALSFITYLKTTAIYEKGFDMKKAVKKIFDLILFLLGLDSECRRKAVDDGICDLSGQGKDRYGK